MGTLLGQRHMIRDKITLQCHFIEDKESRVTGGGQRRITQTNLHPQRLRLGSHRRAGIARPYDAQRHAG